MEVLLTVEEIDHTADVAIRITARDAAEFFQEALRGFNLILLGEEGSRRVQPADEVPVVLECSDSETLLVDFLNELIYLFDARRQIFARLNVESVTIEGAVASLQGQLMGEAFDTERHVFETEVKAATFHDLEIRRTESGLLTADLVFDL